MRQHLHNVRQIIRSAPTLPLISEYLFIILPFIVWVVTKFATGRLVFGELIYIKDWSFAAAILSGQTLIKLTGGFSVGGRGAISIDKIVLITTLLVVLILLPAVIILAYVAGSPESGASPPGMHSNLAVSQITLFFGATLAYYILGGWGMHLQKHCAQSAPIQAAEFPRSPEADRFREARA
jgi:hypothetical protein